MQNASLNCLLTRRHMPLWWAGPLQAVPVVEVWALLVTPPELEKCVESMKQTGKCWLFVPQAAERPAPLWGQFVGKLSQDWVFSNEASPLCSSTPRSVGGECSEPTPVASTEAAR